ncbi:hypothetical protein [Ferrimonas marina]|uniref:Uncharacterized protein n=1 Tax=Ferrimonas marina TaxID=299255 RepID=A0A1M5YCD6_9GAMM|nr:hypothetical protein [Ferrimonas marina]SHI09569.1 hypothetical protein SAMN02745129_4066 [Ferrimonas marina]
MSLFLSALTLASVLPYDRSDHPDWQLYHHYQAFAHAEDNSIYQVIEAKKVPYTPSEFAFTHGEASFGLVKGNLAISVFSRMDWQLDFSEDTMAFYSAIRNKTLIDDGRLYQLDLKAQEFGAQGVKLGYRWPLSERFTLYGAASLLYANSLTAGEAGGYAGLSEDGNYTGEVVLRYTYTRDYLFERPLEDNHSHWGYSLDLGFEWQASEHLTLSGLVQDLASEVKWYDSPYTDAYADTANTIIDPDGSVHVDPIIHGREYYGDYRQSLPRRYQWRANYQRGQHHWQLGGQHYHHQHYLSLGWQTQRDNDSWGVQFYPGHNALALNWRNRYLQLSWMADRLNPRQASLAQLGVSAVLPFQL